MTTLKMSWLVPGVFLAVSASAKVKTVENKNADFSAYHTYEWLPPRVLMKKGLIENDDVVAPSIKEAVGAELKKRGLTEVASGGDLQVSTLALRDVIPQLEALIYPAGYGYGPFNDGFGFPVATLGRYNQLGTLVVNLIDTRTKTSAWAALATRSFERPELVHVTITKAAAEIFRKYPAVKAHR